MGERAGGKERPRRDLPDTGQFKTTKLVSLCIQWSESLEAGWGPPSPEELLEGAQCPLS